jgi:putative transposase
MRFQTLATPTVFSQVIQLIPRTEFVAVVTRHNGDARTRSLDCWSWFGALLFGQLSGHDSIRAIERVFAHEDAKMAKLGFGPVRRSTLADANAVRPVEILEDLFQLCLKRAYQHAPRRHRFRFLGDVFALDSTTIELCLKLCPWARFHHEKSGKGAAKLHTAIDIANDLPRFAVITDGRTHDVRVGREIISAEFKKGDTVVFDRGYVDYAWMNDLNQAGIFFVTRAKSNCHFKVMDSREHDRTRGLRADQEVLLDSQRGGRYQGRLRRISLRDPDTGKWLVFLTNNFELAAMTIAKIYKARWDVELFFKTIKQNLRIKKFLGTSVNAVKSQILVAMIAYLLVQTLRYSLRTSISITDAVAILGTLLLLREPISRLLGDLPRVNRHPPGPQLMLPI